MRYHDTSSANRKPDRKGVTLTEVLMSLMIMSIGVSAVVVLFPLSVLRSVQSTQLTNAAILKRNIESELRQNKKLIFDPDGDYDLATNDAGRFQAIAEHFQGPLSRHYIVDPAGCYAFYGQDNDGSGTIDTTDDLFAASFGNTGSNAGFYVGSPATPRVLPRFDAGVMGLLLGTTSASSSTLTAQEIRALSETALKRARLGDGKTVQLEAFAAKPLFRTLGSSAYLVGLELMDTVSTDELSQIPTSANSNPSTAIPDLENCEVVVFAENGNFSQTFPLTHIDATRRAVFWSEYDDDLGGSAWRDFNKNNVQDVRPLPVEFRNTAGRVVLRSNRAADLTWVMSVRRSPEGGATADVVVRHNVGLSPEDERAFAGALEKNSRFVGVENWADGTSPTIKRGQYMLDPVNARWYRIASVTQPPTYSITDPDEQEFWKVFDYRVELENVALETAGVIPRASTGATYVPSAVIFVPHVVDVYPMSSIALPDSL